MYYRDVCDSFCITRYVRLLGFLYSQVYSRDMYYRDVCDSFCITRYVRLLGFLYSQVYSRDMYRDICDFCM